MEAWIALLAFGVSCFSRPAFPGLMLRPACEQQEPQVAGKIIDMVTSRVLLTASLSPEVAVYCTRV